MSSTDKIFKQLTVLLNRVRSRSIGLEEAEHVLESISCDMRQLAERPACCDKTAQFSPDSSSNSYHEHNDPNYHFYPNLPAAQEGRSTR
jgi:hypothetical protein